jgi:hypothetical protein
MGRKKKEDHKARQPQQAADPLEARQASAKLTATAGALAGVVARFVVGPLDVLKIRFQVQLEPIAAGAMPAHYTSLRQALVTIVKEEGVKVRGDSGAERPIHQATGLWQRRQQRQWCRQRGPLGKEGAAGQGGSRWARREPLLAAGLLLLADAVCPPPLLVPPRRACGAAPCQASC